MNWCNPRQKEVVLRYFVEDRNHPTIYRNIKKLVDEGIITKLTGL